MNPDLIAGIALILGGLTVPTVDTLISKLTARRQTR